MEHMYIIFCVKITYQTLNSPDSYRVANLNLSIFFWLLPIDEDKFFFSKKFEIVCTNGILATFVYNTVLQKIQKLIFLKCFLKAFNGHIFGE